MIKAMEKWVVGLILDENSLEKLCPVKEEIDKLNIKSNVYDLHVSISDFECEKPDNIIKQLYKISSKTFCFSAQIQSVGTFLNDDNVIFFNIKLSQNFLKIKRKIINDVLKDKTIRLNPYYNEENYHPHCTLAYRINDEQYLNLLKNLKNKIKFPIDIKFSKIDLFQHSSKRERVFIANLKEDK